MLSITPCIWFDGRALEAAEFYSQVIPNSRIAHVQPAAADNPSGKAGDVLLVQVELNGVPFTLLNGGPGHPLTDAISFQLNCESQTQVDELWDALTEGGHEVMCGWLTDRFGVSWQVIPSQMGELMGSLDREAAGRAMAAMLTMKKLDINEMRRAFEGN